MSFQTLPVSPQSASASPVSHFTHVRRFSKDPTGRLKHLLISSLSSTRLRQSFTIPSASAPACCHLASSLTSVQGHFLSVHLRITYSLHWSLIQSRSTSHCRHASR